RRVPAAFDARAPCSVGRAGGGRGRASRARRFRRPATVGGRCDERFGARLAPVLDPLPRRVLAGAAGLRGIAGDLGARRLAGVRSELGAMSSLRSRLILGSFLVAVVPLALAM